MYLLIILVLINFFHADSVQAEEKIQQWDCQNEEQSDDWDCEKLIKEKGENGWEDASLEMESIEKNKPSAGNSTTEWEVPKDIVTQEGWNCQPSPEDGTWNCNLEGPDPEGKAKTVERSSGGWWFDPVYDTEQELVFDSLRSKLNSDPWASCYGGSTSTMPIQTTFEDRDSAPVDIEADYSEMLDKEVALFKGNVEFTHLDQKIRTQSAVYDTVSQVLNTEDDFYYADKAISTYGSSAFINLETGKGRLRDMLFIFPDAAARGSAETAYLETPSLTRYDKATFTTCPPGNQDWALHASRLKVNKKVGKASAKNVWLEYKGVPTPLYLPYLSFPVDDRRLSGFLIPSFSSTENTGFDVSLPYYLNLAPNYDAIITPRYLFKRGFMLGASFRHLSERSMSVLAGEILPDDEVDRQTRGFITFKNQTRFSPELRGVLDLNYVTDRRYIDDFNKISNVDDPGNPTGNLRRSNSQLPSSSLGFSNNRFLRSFGTLRYDLPWLNFETLADSYQVIDETIEDVYRPYRHLPQVTLKLHKDFKYGLPVKTGLDNQFVYFQHDDLVTGQRFHTKPFLSIPFEGHGFSIEPKAALDYTQYWLSDLDKASEIYWLPELERQQDDNISRTLPILSVDSKLSFEKAFKLGDDDYSHIIEPRLFYLYIPHKNQNNIPTFDSSENDFNFSQLFRENRFSGLDRIQNTNQLTYALTTRLFDDSSGRERLNLSLGQIFYFADRQGRYFQPDQDKIIEILEKVQPQFRDPLLNAYNNLNGLGDSAVSRDLSRNTSNIVAELGSQLTDDIFASAGLQWNPKSNAMERWHADIHYRNPSNIIFNAGYRFRKNRLLEGDLKNLINLIDREDIEALLSEEDRGQGKLLDLDDINSLINDIHQIDVSARMPLYDNWFLVGRWQYSLSTNVTVDSFAGLEKESCCWSLKLVGRYFVNDIRSDPEFGFLVQFGLKGLGDLGDRVDRFLEQSIPGYLGIRE